MLWGTIHLPEWVSVPRNISQWNIRNFSYPAAILNFMSTESRQIARQVDGPNPNRFHPLSPSTPTPRGAA